MAFLQQPQPPPPLPNAPVARKGQAWRRLARAWQRAHPRQVNLAVLAIAALLLGLWLVASLAFHGSQPNPEPRPSREQAAASASRDGDRVQVNLEGLKNLAVVPVQMRPFRGEREEIGQIAFNEDHATPIFSPYTGRVVHLLAKVGDQVRKGTPLFELDSPDLVQAESDFIGASDALTAAQVRLGVAERQFQRARTLFDAAAIAEKDLEQAQADLRGAQSTASTASAVLAAMHDKLRLFGKSDPAIEALGRDHHIDSITTIASPIAGTVATRRVGPGQFVQPDNTNPLFTVADLSSMWLRVNVAEADIRFVHLGQPLEVRVMAYPSELFRAHVTNVAVAVDPLTRRVAVRAEIPNPNLRLKPDMFATATILSDEGTLWPAVPVNAIVRDGPATTVWADMGPGQFHRRVVQVGVQQGGWVQVLHGLADGDEVVSDGAVFLGSVSPDAQHP